MSDFYSAIVFLSAFIMIIMVLLVRSNDLVEYSEKQTIYTISVLVIAGAVSEWLAVWMDGADPSLRLLHVILKTIELSTAPVIPVLCSSLIRPIRRKKPFSACSRSTCCLRFCLHSGVWITSSGWTSRAAITAGRFIGSMHWRISAACCFHSAAPEREHTPLWHTPHARCHSAAVFLLRISH